MNKSHSKYFSWILFFVKLFGDKIGKVQICLGDFMQGLEYLGFCRHILDSSPKKIWFIFSVKILFRKKSTKNSNFFFFHYLAFEASFSCLFLKIIIRIFKRCLKILPVFWFSFFPCKILIQSFFEDFSSGKKYKIFFWK